MPSISKFDDLLPALTPYLTSPQPLAAMQKDGFTFDGEVAKAISRRKPARAIDPALMQKLEQTFGPPLPTRIHIGKLPALPPPPPPPSGFRAIAAMRLETIYPVLAELWNVGTIPQQLSAAQTAEIIDLPTLRQLCNNVPTASDAALGALRIASAPSLSASSNSGNLHVDVAFELPVLGSQPASFKGAVHVEIPLGLETYVDTHSLLRLRLALDASGVEGATCTIQVGVDSVIVPNSSASQSTLESKFTTGIRAALFYYSVLGTLSLPAQHKLSSFPNTVLDLRQQGAVTVNRNGQSFGIIGFNMGAQQQVDASALISANTPVSPYDTHVELVEACADDILNAFIQSGDLASFVSRFVGRHTDNLGPQIDCTSGSVSLQNGTVTITVGFVARNACLGLDVNFTMQASGPPIISNGYMSIGAQYLDVSFDTWDEILCYLASILVPFGPILLTAVLTAISGGHDAPAKSINVSPSFAPLPGSAMDWSIVMQQASATNGTLALNGATSLVTDPRIFVYLRVVQQSLYPLPPQPVANAQVTLLELDNPAPGGDDVVIPSTGNTTIVNQKFTIDTSTSYQPSSDQTIGTQSTDEDGNVLFVINTATSGGTPALNNIGGIENISRTQTDNHNGNIISSTHTISYVLEGKPDFGVTVVDASGAVRLQRRLVALNVVGNRVGTKEQPVIVELQRVIVNEPVSVL